MPLHLQRQKCFTALTNQSEREREREKVKVGRRSNPISWFRKSSFDVITSSSSLVAATAKEVERAV